MDIRATLKPGQNGTKKFVEKYGDRLVTVRYRYDAATGKSYKAVELIVDERDWSPKNHSRPPYRPSRRLGVRIDYHETELREQAKALGGIWRPRHKLWELSYDAIIELDLEDRVVEEIKQDDG